MEKTRGGSLSRSRFLHSAFAFCVLSFDGPQSTTMRIGITCYPTFGGSGVVATELGIALAPMGDDVPFTSYALPSRLNILHERVRFHEVTVTPYPLCDPCPPYTLALATKMAEIAEYERLDVLHVHYAIPHAISAHLAREILGDKMHFVTTLHGTDITLVGRDASYLPITKFGIEVSDGVTAVSNSLRDEAFCRQHHLKDRVFFLGNVPNLEEIVGGSDLFLLPSEHESFGMAALEAMASEVPVIATRAGGLPEVVADVETGYLLPVGDVDAMAERAIVILSDKTLHRRLGCAGRARAEE